VLALAFVARSAFRLVAGFGTDRISRRTLWARKSIRLVIGLLTALLLLSIWFDDTTPKREDEPPRRKDSVCPGACVSPCDPCSV
jgi:MFS family permease